MVGDGRCLFRALVRAARGEADQRVERDAGGQPRDPAERLAEIEAADCLRREVCDAMLAMGVWAA